MPLQCKSGNHDVITPGSGGAPDLARTGSLIAIIKGISIDRLCRPNYSDPMDSLEQTGKDLQRLEQHLRKLLAQTEKLSEENASLQTRQDSLVAERAVLVAKNDEARSKVEAMIHRLKALEQS